MTASPLPRHGGQALAIAKHFGLDSSQLLDFSANINPAGPPATAIAALESGLTRRESLTQYPDLGEAELKEALAVYARVSPGEILVANGFVPLLDAALRALRIRSCLLPVPAFNEYRSVLERNGVQIVPHALQEENGFRYDLQALGGGSQDAILLANPQNPTGILCDRGSMQQFVASAAAHFQYVLLDEAFIDYAPGDSLASAVSKFTNLIVFRSVTKFFGVPGLRVAYAAAGQNLLSAIEAFLAPWPITTLASQAVITAVADEPYAMKSRLLNEKRRAELSRELSNLGLAVYSGAANFLLLRNPLEVGENTLWERMLLEHGIVLRNCDDYDGLPRGYLRAAIRDETANQHLVQAFAKLLSVAESDALTGPAFHNFRLSSAFDQHRQNKR